MVNDIETNMQPEPVQEPQVEPVQEQVYTGQSRVEANYNIISDEEQAYAEYEKWKKQQELYKPENRLQEQGDFVLRELERGVPLKQAMYEAGIGKENLTEVSALLDPVNFITDIFTGGTLRGLKLAREGGEIGLRHALSSMSKASAVDAGYGLLASSGIDLTHEFTDNSLIQMVGGVTTPVVASTLVQGFRRTGIQGLKAIADNLRKNNPEIAEQLARQADNYAEANLAINTASRSEVINDGSITGVAQNINTASTDLAHAIDSPRINVQTSQELRQQSQEALSKAASASTDEERSMYLAEAFNKAFVDAFRTPEQKKALEVVQDTISRSMQPESVAHNSPVSASGESLGSGARPGSQDGLQGNSVEGVTPGLKSEGEAAAPGRVQPDAGEAAARVEGEAQAIKPEAEPTVKGDDSNNNKNHVKPYTSEEIEGFKKAVLENDLAAPQNKTDYNYDKIADGRDLKELIAKSFESFDFSKVTEGTRTWNEAVKIAEDHGLYDLVKTFRNTKNLDSQTFGALRTMHSLGDEVTRLAREATVAMTPESVAKAEHAIELFTDSLLMAKGIQTEIARGLGIMRKMRVGGEDIASTVMKHLENNGGIELFETKLQILKSLGESGNKKALTQMIVGSTYTKTRDAFIELYMGAMLSNPSTFLPVVGVNSVGGVASLFQNYTERWLASTWLGGRGVSKAEVEEFKRGIFDALKPRNTNEEMIQDRPLKALFEAAQIASDDVKYALHGVSLGVLDGTKIGKALNSDAMNLGSVALVVVEVQSTTLQS